MISNLPQEILSLIATCVASETDRHQCLFVSRSWLQAFRPILYHHICIKNRKQYQQFQKYIQNYTKYVKQLEFKDNVGISRDELDQLPHFLPNIERLYFHPRIWKYQRKKQQFTWDRLIELPPLLLKDQSISLLEHHGANLQSLTLTPELLQEIHAILKYTPHLNSLFIIGRDKASMNPALLQRHSFSLTDINQIHAALPELKHITLSQVALTRIDTASMCETTYPLIENFTVQDASLLSDANWLTFIAAAYPNLVTLILDAIWHPTYKQTMKQTDYTTVKNGILKIGKNYRQLKHIRVGDVGSVVRAADRLFFDTLHKNGMSLNTIDCTVSSAMNSNKESFDAMMRCTSQHLHTLRIQLWRDIRSIESIVSPLSQCANVSELELICGTFAYAWSYGCEMDTILDFCPRLTTLKLTTARMTRKGTTSHGTRRPSASNLKNLILKKVHFSTDAFEVVSERCPDLKHLVLDHCVKEKDALNHQMRIALPHARLETCTIDHISLRPSAFFEKCSIDAAILALELPESQCRYYHLYSRMHSAAKHVRSLRRLSVEETREIRCYSMTEKAWELLEDQAVRGTYRQRQFWRSDIPYGYVHIQAEAIEKLVFNSVIYT
ncbi:hypothetical protein K501DRAFT_244049 [Backusella circina FSU 941]|nr:hypothetical protein K501DRAFT_244049 [Backusella circina FSU 941]